MLCQSRCQYKCRFCVHVAIEGVSYQCGFPLCFFSFAISEDVHPTCNLYIWFSCFERNSPNRHVQRSVAYIYIYIITLLLSIHPSVESFPPRFHRWELVQKSLANPSVFIKISSDRFYQFFLNRLVRI
jgi:hypothetical protein